MYNDSRYPEHLFKNCSIYELEDGEWTNSFNRQWTKIPGGWLVGIEYHNIAEVFVPWHAEPIL